MGIGDFRRDNMDKNYFIEKLEQRQVDPQESKGFWDNRAKEFYSFSKKSRKDSTIEFLKGFMDLKDKRVLDVGFGAGRYLKLLADEGAKVSGVELSSEMMEYAKKYCMENGIDVEQMELYNIPWEDVDLDRLNWRNKFDLVFASMSPVLDSYESIKKLIDASKQGIFYSTHIVMDEDILSKVYEDINGKEYSSKKESFWYLFNILYLDGYYPNVRIEGGESQLELSIGELLNRYVNRVFSDTPSEKDLIRLKESIKKHEVDGKVIVNMKRKNGLIYFEK